MAEKIIERILKGCDPESIILFGSRAQGTARANSDYDLLIIAESNLPRQRRSVPIYRILADLPIEVDVLVYTPEEARSWRNVPEALVTRAIQEGIVLYARESRAD